MVSRAAQDVLALMEDGYNIVQFIGHDDKPHGYYLRKPPPLHGYRERVPARTAKIITAMPNIKFTKTTNWKVWSLQ